MTKPTVFPTHHILTVLVLTMIVYLVPFLLYFSFKQKDALRVDRADRQSIFLVLWTLLAAFAVRVMVSCLVVGHKTDINCFTAWGYSLATRGFKTFYNPETGMPDYPPGYMYIIGLMSKLALITGHGIKDANGNYDLVYVFFIKLPSIIADLAASYLVFKLARNRLKFTPALLLMAIVAFSPLMIYISAGWGQIDQILAVLIFAAILLLNFNKPILCGVFYGLAILMKPQALMVGPLMALAYGFYVFDKGFFRASNLENPDKLWKRLLKTGIAVAAACLMIIITALPFSTKEMPWYDLIYRKYLGTATSYKFASVNAYNIYTLFGKNWTPIDRTAIFGLNYGQVGTIGMVISVVTGGVLYVLGTTGKRRNPGALFIATAYTFVALFTLGHYMHERYLFPMLLMLVGAYLFYGERRLLYFFFAYSVTTMLNCLAAFYYSKYHEFQLYWDTKLVFWCSLANVVLFVLFTVFCFMLVLRKGRKNELEFAPGEARAAEAGIHDSLETKLS